MEITSELKAVSSTISDTASTISEPKHITSKIPEGAVIKAEITNISPNEVTIRTESGEQVTGKLAEQLQAKIGDRQVFTVRYDESGNMLLEAKPIAVSDMQQKAIADALMAMGLKPKGENIEIATMLLSNRLPLDKETFLKFSQALKLIGPEPQQLEKALFMMQNEIKPTPKNAEMLNQYTSGSQKISAQLSNLIKGIEQLNDPKLQENLVKALMGESIPDKSTKPELLPAKIAQSINNAELSSLPKLTAELAKAFPEQKDLVIKLLNDKLASASAKAPTNTNQPDGKPLESLAGFPKNVSTEAIAKFLYESVSTGEMDESVKHLMNDSEIKEFISRLSKEQPQLNELIDKLKGKLSFKFQQANPKEINEFLNRLQEDLNTARSELIGKSGEDIENLLKDMGKAKDNIDFVNNLKSNIFVQLPVQINTAAANAELYVFRDKKSKPRKSGASSALIALDTENLGRFEVFVQKKENSVNCQFRLESERTEALTRSKISELNTLLKQYGYSLDGFSFKQLSEKFTLIDRPPDSAAASPLPEQTRLVFDIRT